MQQKKEPFSSMWRPHRHSRVLQNTAEHTGRLPGQEKGKTRRGLPVPDTSDRMRVISLCDMGWRGFVREARQWRSELGSGVSLRTPRRLAYFGR